MKLDVVDINGKKVKEYDLPASIFEAPVNIDLMHQAFVRQEANARLGTHETKERGEVSGGGRKPWRQKGTGRARQGSIRAAQWVGGGKIFTPHMRSYRKRMPKKMRRAALRSALTSKISNEEVMIVNQFDLSEAKTSVFTKVLRDLAGEKSVLVILPDKNSREKVMLSARNAANAKVIYANYLNVRDLLKYEQVIFDESSMPIIESYLGDEKRKK